MSNHDGHGELQATTPLVYLVLLHQPTIWHPTDTKGVEVGDSCALKAAGNRVFSLFGTMEP